LVIGSCGSKGEGSFILLCAEIVLTLDYKLIPVVIYSNKRVFPSFSFDFYTWLSAFSEPHPTAVT
jgi:hypothetical protein